MDGKDVDINMRICFLLIFSCMLLLGCYPSTRLSEEPSAKIHSSKFVTPGTYAPDYHFLKKGFDLRFKSEDLNWETESNVFFVHFYDSVGYIMSLPFDGEESEIYTLYSIDGAALEGSAWSFERCMERNIKENIANVYSLCKKNVTVPRQLIEKMRSFLMEDRLSIINIGCASSYEFSIFIYDGVKYHYLEIVKPSCIDGDLKNDPRIPEYIEFYNEMAAFIKQDFSACRWDNFGNKEKIIRECGKFNWRWKEKYPDLVK